MRGTRTVIPKKLRHQVLEISHEGHPGIVSMKQCLRYKVWWLGIDRNSENICRECYGCQLVAQPTRPEPIKRTEFPNAPWQHLACDLLGPLPSADFIFAAVDYSRFFELEFTKSMTAGKITSILTKTFTSWPTIVITD